MGKNLFEGKRRHFSSGQKSPTATGWLHRIAAMLILVLGGMVAPEMAMAGDNDITESCITFEDKLKDNGYIKVSFPHYDDLGVDEYLRKDGGSCIYVNNTKVLWMWSEFNEGTDHPSDQYAEGYKCTYKLISDDALVAILKDDAEGYKDAVVPLYNNGHTNWSKPRKRVDRGGGKYYSSCSEVYIYPAAYVLNDNDKITITVHLDVKSSGSARDYTVTKSKTYKYEKPALPTFSSVFDPYMQKGLKIDCKRKGKGDRFLYKLSDEKDYKTVEVGSDQYHTLYFDLSNNPRSIAFKFNHRINDWKWDNSDYVKDSQKYIITKCNDENLTVPAYFTPGSVSAKQNDKTSLVDLSWSLETNGCRKEQMYKDGNKEPMWVVDRSNSDEFKEDATKTFEKAGKIEAVGNKGTVDYQFTDATVVDEALNGKYYYRVRRNDSPWGTKDSKITEVLISNIHKDIDTIGANKPTASIGAAGADIKWRLCGKHWTEDSKIVIQRYTEDGNANGDPISIDDTSIINKGVYTDKFPEPCVVYTYKIKVEPGNQNYAKGMQDYVDVLSKTSLFISERGKIETLKASKGYYGDQVTLEWTSDDGRLDAFDVYTRLYGSNDEFKWLGQELSSGLSKNFTYNHKKTDAVVAIPGEVYEYMVVAKNVCGGNSNVDYIDTLYTTGFSTPTGTVYGRITFESGQSEDNVEVRLEPVDGGNLEGKSYMFSGDGYLQISNAELLSKASEFTLQVWVKPDSANGVIARKGKKFSLYIEDGIIKSKIGENSIASPERVEYYQKNADFLHLSVVVGKDTAKNSNKTIATLFVNGKDVASGEVGDVPVDNDTIKLGEGYKGTIDEVRLWNTALDSANNAKTYNRYLVGNEAGLVAYYPFDYSTDSEFYDVSYSGAGHNCNHGTVVSAKIGSEVPTINQLGYRGYTNDKGEYTIRSIPYKGTDGTTYRIVPLKGNHTFKQASELCRISGAAQSHNINFVDNSSFKVSGTVMYSGGEYPVEGVEFQIDGVKVLRQNGETVKTDADGAFTINVPVGRHEVKAVKNGHVFELDGRICEDTSATGGVIKDIDYQDIKSNIELWDATKVKYIGRICGGEVQEGYKVGFSLSKNNLADDMTITLKPNSDKSYLLQKSPHKDTVAHTVLKATMARDKNVKPHTTVVDYNLNDITIHVNNTTGEFVAYVYPIDYKIALNVNGHKEISGDRTELKLSGYKLEQYEVYEHEDSVYVNGVDAVMGYVKSIYKDSVSYEQKQVFTKRYPAQMDVKQINNSGNALSYFGKKEHISLRYTGDKDTIPLYVDANKSYTFGLPVFVSCETYMFKYNIFEEYKYYKRNGSEDTEKTDRVEINNAEVTFENTLAYSSEIDTSSHIYMFKVADPNMTNAKGNISATFKLANTTTSFGWDENVEGYVFGSQHTGTDFVTGGPDKFLCVLRDPPGSNSYSYFEKGVSFKESSTYTGSVSHYGDYEWEFGYKKELNFITLTVTPATGTGTKEKTMSLQEFTNVNFSESEEYTGSNSKSTNFTLKERIQTSSDPSYVGADGDLYVGYSTNISFGNTYDITAIPIALYDSAGSEFFDTTYMKTADWAIVKTKGVSAVENFNTMFAYPQSHIENRLIPNLKDLRKDLMTFISTREEAEKEEYKKSKKELARKKKDNIYVSFVPVTDDNFAQEGYYTVFFADTVKKCDTIHYINQAIVNWENAIAKNDSAKAMADDSQLVQNFSFAAGSNIEYSESNSSTLSSSHSFSIKLGFNLHQVSGREVLGVKTKFTLNQSVSTTQGGTFANDAERNHSKGFVLAESGDDYLSVDVFNEKISDFNDSYVTSVGSGKADTSKITDKKEYPTFIFRTRAGATSCPYEGEYKATHWKGHEDKVINAATKQIEKPLLEMANNFIDNVPSCEEAFLTIRMMNNSETGDGAWLNLRLLDDTNPYGAVVKIDGTSISGRSLDYYVRAGDVLEKTLAVSKGSIMNYDSLGLVLSSKCDGSLSSKVFFSVHYLPSCSKVNIEQPSDNWTYNTKCDTRTIDGIEKHYMPVSISGFDANYTDFDHIELQYKPSSGSDNDWMTLRYFYADTSLTNKAVANGFDAVSINGGVIAYEFFMDGLDDMRYDIRAVSFCNINNVLYENVSEIVSGIKDMYVPRKFGSEKPADGVLTANDEIRLDFNETIAGGKLTSRCFKVEGVRNGQASDHSVSVTLDGANDYMTTEATRNLSYRDLTFECSVFFSEPHNATFFSHGSGSKSIEMGMNQSGNIVVKMGGKTFVSETAPKYATGWNNIALVYNNEAKTITAYVNQTAVIDGAKVEAYDGDGMIVVGRGVDGANYFKGKVDQFRIWNAVRTFSELNKSVRLSGSEVGLIACYDMDEAKGSVTEDKARGAHLSMKGCEWALPEGRSAEFNGKDNYIKIENSNAQTTKDKDLTLEFWFNAKSGAKSQTILSSGDGISNVGEDSSRVFSVGFNGDGKLSFRHNGIETVVKGNYADDNWHNFTLAVSRTSGHARIYMDGELNTYFDANSIAVISLDPVYVGARVWYNEKKALERTADQFFEGRVDELRFWNLYRQQSQVEAFYNQQTNGDEMGLKLYYPFEYYKEWQGDKSLQFTLRDSANKKENEADNIGGVVGSTNIPPVKSKGMTSYLNYSWVVNDDALIINLEEDAYRIEKTIVTFTVDRVEDVNGNPIASPISWSAYIDRNQLKWIDDAVSISKKQYADTTFKATMTNNGGSVINYSLENMPSWLSADKTSGSINPKSSKTVEFTVDPALAVGTYSEVVYLTNSDNTTEALTLDITVEGETPEWKINPNEFEYTMDVFAQIKIDDQYSNDKNDMIAAFDKNGKCVGVAHTSYNKTMDMWYTILTVYSNSSSNELSFRIWDASAGIMSEATPSSVNLKFEMNAVHGSPSSPVVFTNDEVRFQNIHLNKGWNWVSFNLKNSQMSENRDAYLANGEWGSNSIIKGLNTTYLNYSTVSNKWIESKSSSQQLTLNNANMFKIYSDEEQVLSVSGSPINLSSNPITAKAGWNYIAYLPSQSLTLKTALADYEAKEGDIIRSSSGFAMYFGHEWIGSLTFMQPNNGYMLKNTGAAEKKFTYPANAGSLRSAFAVETEPTEFESNMGVVAFVPEKEDGDIVKAVSADGESKSVVVKTAEGKSVEFITIAANNGAEIKFELERGGETYTANNVMRFASDAVYGTPGEPVILDFFGGRESLVVNPNPVEDVMNIRGGFAQDGEATIELFDIVGILVYRGEATVANSILDASINASGLTTGSYLLKVTIGDETSTVKVLKK